TYGAAHDISVSETINYLVDILPGCDQCGSCRMGRGPSCLHICLDRWNRGVSAECCGVLSSRRPLLLADRPPLLVALHLPTPPAHPGSGDPCQQPRQSGRSSTVLVSCKSDCLPQRDEECL